MTIGDAQVAEKLKEIDDLIRALPDDVVAASRRLVEMGEGGLRRLLGVLGGRVPMFRTSSHDYRDVDGALGNALARFAELDPERTVRVVSEMGLLGSSSVVWYLGQVDDARLVPVLVTASKNRRAGVRSAAFNGLARHRDPIAVAALLAGLGDRAPTVRNQVARLLGEVGDGGAIGALEAVLETSKSEALRRAARESLVRLRSLKTRGES